MPTKTPIMRGTSITDLEIREIWVPRDDNQIEFKPWLIYTILLNPLAQQKIADFIQEELRRFPIGSSQGRDLDLLKKSITHYTELAARDPNLPPRLIWFTLTELNALPTELVRCDGYTLGDSIGGIGYGRPREHNRALAAEVDRQERILVSPGILSRIPINVDGVDYFIFQLAEKNLRTKGELFYKPIGGHMKYTELLQQRFEEYGLERKFRNQPQDERDFAFFVSSRNFQSFRELFHSQVLHDESRWMIVPPEETLIEELEEELGPIHSSDGVPILSYEDLRPYDYRIG